MSSGINFDESDIKDLIENRIPLSILNGMEGRVIPIILSLDGPPGSSFCSQLYALALTPTIDIIYQQIQLREYFLNMGSKILTEVAHGKPKLGLAFLDFIFHPLIRDSEEAKGCSLLQLEEAKLLLGWLRHTKHNLASLSYRFTEAALANLVCRATSNDQIVLLWSILRHNVRLRSTCELFLIQILQDCSNIIKIAIGQQYSQEQLLCLLELICKEKGKGALKISASSKAEIFYTHLYLALSDVCTPLYYFLPLLTQFKNQFDELMESVTNVDGGVNLPVALSSRLLELYIQYFSDQALGYPNFNEKKLQQAIRIAALCVSESGSNAVIENLKVNCDNYKGVGMIHWLLCPYQPLPFTLTTEDAKILRVILYVLYIRLLIYILRT